MHMNKNSHSIGFLFFCPKLRPVDTIEKRALKVRDCTQIIQISDGVLLIKTLKRVPFKILLE